MICMNIQKHDKIYANQVGSDSKFLKQLLIQFNDQNTLKHTTYLC
jgi:hypothetical protein